MSLLGPLAGLLPGCSAGVARALTREPSVPASPDFWTPLLRARADWLRVEPAPAAAASRPGSGESLTALRPAPPVPRTRAAPVLLRLLPDGALLQLRAAPRLSLVGGLLDPDRDDPFPAGLVLGLGLIF